MFSKIDNVLIDKAQWIVRQIELFTPLTRRRFGLSIFLLGRIVTILALFLTYPLLLISTVAGVSEIPFLIVTYFQLKKIEKIFEMTNQEGTSLPREIYTRRHDRFLLIFLLAFFLILITSRIIIYPSVTILFLGIIINCLVIAMTTASEYLLCTTSLPPGEKERKKQERESKRMTPSLTRVLVPIRD